MKSILITGQYNRFVQLLIERFDKEGWRISTMSQEKNAPPNVFQHYATNLEVENLRNILESCKPNVLIFTGAYDGEFFTHKIRHSQSQRYIAYLSALLMEANRRHVQKFIYISSEAVYDESFATDIFEDMQANASSTTGSILCMGETLAKDFAGNSAMDVITLRMPNLYSVPMSSNDCHDLISSKCLQAVMMKPVEISSKYSYNTIFGRDAVEAIFSVIKADEHRYDLYHVASPEVIRDRDVMDAIKDNANHAIEIQDSTGGLESQRILNGERFAKEFDFHPRGNVEKSIKDIMQSIRGNMRSFDANGEDSRTSRARKLLQNAMAVLEVVTAVILCYFLTQVIASNASLSGINLYLLCSLLFSAFYGTKIGILSAVLCTVAYFIGLSGGGNGLAMMVDVGVYIWIAQLFIVTLAVGYVRDTLTQTRADIGEEVQFLQGRLEDISSINDSNAKIKDFFENRVVDSNESIGAIYNIVSSLDTANRNSVLFEATKIFTHMMGTKDVAIYRLMDNGFLRLVTSTGERARVLGKSLHRDQISRIFERLDSKKLFINHNMDPAQPSLVGALNNADGNTGFVVMLWDVDYEHMTLYNTNMLRVICELISNAVIRAADYLEVVQNTRVIGNTSIMTQQAFEELCDVFKKAKAENLADYCLLEVATQGRTVEELSEVLSHSLRLTDMMGQIDRDRIHILLNNTSLQDAMVVIRRLNAVGLQVSVLG